MLLLFHICFLSVISRRTTMISWLLLFSLFIKSTQGGNAKENDVSKREPQNLKLTSSEQTLWLTWEDDPSLSAKNGSLIYELEVLIEDQQVHYEEVVVMPDQIGSPHSWKWTSHLAEECASHLVRLRSRYGNHVSPWKQQQTLPRVESSALPQVFPVDKVFMVGTMVTFCCIVPAEEMPETGQMYVYGYNSNTTKINNQTYTLTVNMSQASDSSCTNIMCKTESSSDGACAYFGYPPNDKDLLCETQDLQSVECHWTSGRNPLSLKNPTAYQLLGSDCADGFKGVCKMKVHVEAGERNWTLTAQNKLGMLELSDVADLTKRVHMSAPEGLRALAVNARNATVQWVWTVQQYNNLNVTCQVKLSQDERHTVSEMSGIGLNSLILSSLTPYSAYRVTVRCGTTNFFWKWSDWSLSINFFTKGDVPDALDVWMQVKGNQTIIIWKKPLAIQSHGEIQDYEVTWAKSTQREQVKNRRTVHNELALSLDTTEEYIITVTARNDNGSSPPSMITIPRLDAGSSERVDSSSIIGTNGFFNLSWSPSPTASCGYIVDWCPTTGRCSLEWLKVPLNETSAKIFSKNLNDGVRYSLSVYACTLGAPVVLEKREGYVREKSIEDGLFKSLKWKQKYSNVVISWDAINQKEQSAFIQGYTLYCLDKDSNGFSVNTANPDATSLTVTNLSISSYTFTVKAKTAVGECGTTFISATLNSPTDDLVKPVIISLIAVLSVICLITVFCCCKWTWLKDKVYPPIPRPVLTDKWFTSSDENHCPLHVEQCAQCEADTVDVSFVNSVALDSAYVSQENMLFVFGQLPKGNQPLKKCSPQLLPLPIATNLPQSGLLYSPFKSLFSNPSYNLIMCAGDQQSNPGSEPQEDAPTERNSSGYKPQDHEKTCTPTQTTDDLESPMPCVSSYIILPESSSK